MTLYTSNSFVEDLFLEQGQNVKRLKFNLKISGEEIRNMKNEGNESWKKYVPKESLVNFE
jgi:nicotinamide mononucleotide adenylyltransferase